MEINTRSQNFICKCSMNFIFVIILVFIFNAAYAQVDSAKVDDYNHVKIVKVIDGDTFELENGERVRLLGIDTPEKWDSNKLNTDAERSKKDKEVIKNLGVLAFLYTDSVLSGKYVKLVMDSTNSDRDKYNRLLRYAYLENGEFFNLKIIQDGYAYAYTRFPIIFLEQFREAEKEARENKRGLWGDIDFQEMK